MPQFAQVLAQRRLTLRRSALEVLQVNVGRKCNQACRHCHVDAAPWRTEMMDERTAKLVGEWIQHHRPPIVDLTGGAPELNPHFCYLVQTARASGCHVLDRNNLTILEEAGFEWLPEFLAEHDVEIIASLPCYLPDNVSKQRGAGVYEKSIRALQRLNAIGYGTRLSLHLVYNPVGPTLPGPQAELEADYKEALRRDHGIDFHHLYTITNQPIARFAADLKEHGAWDDYLELLEHSFNPDTLPGLMCRTTLSVDYQGRLYDCDFNQMRGLALTKAAPKYLWDLHPLQLDGLPIETDYHCFACTAGCGSSCTGALKDLTPLRPSPP
jgi:radical SAM/Cys-rich protein